jgi:hypothetical protein
MHDVPADCPNPYLYIWSRKYCKMGTIPNGDRRLQCSKKQPLHKRKSIHATCPLFTINSVMALHDPEPVVSDFNSHIYLKLLSHILGLYGGLPTRISHFLLGIKLTKRSLVSKILAKPLQIHCYARRSGGHFW